MMRLATSALRLLVIVIRAVSTAACALFKETRSFSTEHSGFTVGRDASSRGLPAELQTIVVRPNHVTTASLCIASVLRTLTYELGPSGSARREMRGQPRTNPLLLMYGGDPTVQIHVLEIAL